LFNRFSAAGMAAAARCACSGNAGSQSWALGNETNDDRAAAFEMTTQECTDGTIEKTMSTASSPTEDEVCSRRDIEKTTTGYVIDSVGNFGGLSITRHSELIGDLDAGYVEKSTSRSRHGPSHTPREDTTTTEAKWLGACKPDQKPGDIVMPGGLKMNINDARKRDGKLYLRLK
jgi:hypothetical protein